MVNYEVGLLSRGGQGGVTLGKVLAYAATYDGKYTSAIPKYGAERRGAPVVASVRIFDHPVRRHAQIPVPTEMISLDVSLIPRFYKHDPFEGRGSLTLNAGEFPEAYRIYTPLKFGYANIQEIAKKHDLVKSGSTLIGIPTLGAFVATTKIVSLESLHKAVDKMFPNSSFLAGNHAAVDEAHDTTVILTLEELEEMKKEEKVIGN